MLRTLKANVVDPVTWESRRNLVASDESLELSDCPIERRMKIYSYLTC